MRLAPWKAAALMSKFKKLEQKLESKGKSKEQADGIAAKVGFKKFGKRGMEAKAAAGRAKKHRSRKRG